MTSESASRSDFKDKISLHLEALLQLSFCLTKNRRDATRLMRDAMAEAYRSWDEPMPERGCRIWLYRILIKRFSNGFQQHSHPLVPIAGGSPNEDLVSKITTDDRQQSPAVGEPDEDVIYFRAMASLPRVLRSAMILAYLEGFSNKEIANLAGVQPQAVESWLNRGRTYLREELFAHLTASDAIGMDSNLAN